MFKVQIQSFPEPHYQHHSWHRYPSQEVLIYRFILIGKVQVSNKRAINYYQYRYYNQSTKHIIHTHICSLIRTAIGLIRYDFLLFFMKCSISHFFQYRVCPRFLHSPWGKSPLATILLRVASETRNFSLTSSVLNIGLRAYGR